MKKIIIILVSLILTFSLVYAEHHYQSETINTNYKECFFNQLPKAKAGDPQAENYIGNLYLHGLGVKQDYKKAFDFFQKAAEKNDPEALNNLGIIYQNSLGVKQDYKRAFDFFQKAADLKCTTAVYNLAGMYVNDLGVKRDYKKAFDLFQKAAEKNYPEAEVNLGLIYYFGLLGVEKNYIKAKNYMELAAKNGLPGAQYNLGNIFLEGKFEAPNYNEAYFWYYVAYLNGYKDANLGISKAETFLQKENISDIKKTAKQWVNEHKKIDTELRSANSNPTINI